LDRPFNNHINDNELNALVPASSESGHELPRLSPDAIREAESHVRSCVGCSSKLSKYRQLVSPPSNGVISQVVPPGADCPNDEDVDWYEVAAGLWPELRAKQLITHAALCDHCGPLLRLAASVNDDPTPQEEELLSQLKAPWRPDSVAPAVWAPKSPWQLITWLVPAAALLVITGVLVTRPVSSPTLLSGPKLGEFAVSTYKQHTRGSLALDVRSESQQALNEWFKTKSPFFLALPASPAAAGEERPYRLEGARLVQLSGKTAAYIAYRMATGPVGLMVTPDSVAIASGGIQVDFKKVSFHYGVVEGYKVVTWSIHGLTYALVSQEGNSTQQSCMVCHSNMRDRDLSHTPTPLRARKSVVEFFSN
jgi:hypothetical protein